MSKKTEQLTRQRAELPFLADWLEEYRTADVRLLSEQFQTTLRKETTP